MEKTKELVFIPGPGLGHLVSAVEFGQKILSRHHHLFITYLLMDMVPNDKALYNYTQSLSSTTTPRLRFTNVSRTQPDYTQELNSKNLSVLLVKFICSQKPLVREAVLEIIKLEYSQVVGFIVDLFCVSMIDVADEFKIPSYVFFTSSAGFLSTMLQVQTISDELKQDITEYKDTDKEFLIPGFQNQVPAKVLPSGMLDKHGSFDLDMSIARRIRGSKGIILNTFMELETNQIKALLLLSDGKNPPVYPIGPVINLKHHSDEDEKIRRWLDNQPVSSVVFLCFGSWGWLKGEQVKEVAAALERSGYRFLWSLRRPPMDGPMGSINDYENPGEVLPTGFLERTCGVGKVIGRAPQVAVLSHPAIGGFVSHCGWNSILESVWFGVPIAGWPIYAEQHVNAFEMVVELGLAVDINMDRKIIVTSEEIERGIRQLMNGNEVRRKVKEMKEKSHKTLIEGGSSYDFLGRLIDAIVQDSVFSNT